MSQFCVVDGLRNVQNGHVHCGPLPPTSTLLPTTLPGLEFGGELAAMSCSSVAHGSERDHSWAALASLSRMAASSSVIWSRIGSISMVPMYKSRWKSLMAARNSLGRNWVRYCDSALKSWMCSSMRRFSTGKGSFFSMGLKVLRGVSGVEVGTSKRRYSTGSGRASRETSLPYISFSL